MKQINHYNPFRMTDVQAIKQALSMTNERYRIIRQTVNKFDDKGRPSSIQEIDYIEATVTKTSDRVLDKRNGNGGWNTETFEISCCYPHYLRNENILEHPYYGNLKVTDVDDMREYGLTTAKAVRMNSIRNINDRGE